MSREEHLMENALIAVQSHQDLDTFMEHELGRGNIEGIELPLNGEELIALVYELAQYVIYTWEE